MRERRHIVRSGTAGILSVLIAAVLAGCGGSSEVKPKTRLAGKKQLMIYSRILRLPGEGRETGKVLFWVEIPYSHLTFYRKDSIYTAEVDFTFGFRKADAEQFDYLKDEYAKIEVDKFAETRNPQKLLIRTRELELPPGNYVMHIAAEDRHSGASVISESVLDVPDFFSALALSDPVLVADSLHSIDENNRISLTTRQFTRDFYAFVYAGGLQNDLPFFISVQMVGTGDAVLYAKKYRYQAVAPRVSIVLPIPARHLSVGYTRIFFTLSQGEEKVVRDIVLTSSINMGTIESQDISLLIEAMRYIMEKDDWERLRSLPADSQKTAFLEFWRKRNPEKEPDPDHNPLLEEFINRIEESNLRFSYGSREGWRTDRGHIYIVYGPPDEIQRGRSYRSNVFYEVWNYYELGRQFYFRDDYNSGNYRLVTGRFL